MPVWIIKIEEILIFVLALFVYYQLDFNWILFLVTWLIPDLGIAGYLVNKRFGAFFYNFFHNYLVSFGLILTGIFFFQPLLLSLGIIFTSHVSLDRFLGYGLKYPTSDFKQTHMQKI